MLIKRDWTLAQVLKRTWKFDLFIIFSCLLVYLIYDRGINNYFKVPAMLSTVLGTAIAFFIGFNNSQAYGRWWEARIIWGALVNDSRSWTRGLLAYVRESNDSFDNSQIKVLQKRMIYRHLAFLYTLKYALRKISDTSYKQYLEKEDFEQVRKKSNVPNAILNLQSHDLETLSQLNSIDGFRFKEINYLLIQFCDSMGRCERIKNTVFPTSYIYFTRIFIWFFIILNTMVLTDLIGGWAIFFGWLIGFVFFAAYNNGVSIMNPFENSPFDTPMDSIVRTIEINTLETLNEQDIPEPVKPVNNEYIL